MAEQIMNRIPAGASGPGGTFPAGGQDDRRCGGQMAGSIQEGAPVDWEHLRERLAAVRGRWDLAVLANLARDIARPGELIEAIRQQAAADGEISWTVLTRTLRRLEKDGYVSREEVSQLPRVTRYWLTPTGWRLIRWLTWLDTFCEETEPCDDHPRQVRGQDRKARDGGQHGARCGAA